MILSEVPWIQGQEIAPVEFEQIHATYDLQEIYATAQHASPGIAFSQPDACHTLEKGNFGLLFETGPDEEDDDSQLHFFRGQIENEDELAVAVADSILRGQFEVAAGLYFFFDSANFSGWQLDIIEALPEFFWFRFSPNTASLEAKVLHLLEKDDRFQTVKRFLQAPNSSDFSEAREQVEMFGEFGFLYQ